MVTGEGLTELLVISRADYLTMMTGLRIKDAEEKVQLLKHTHYFSHMSDQILTAFARFMEPRLFRIGETVILQLRIPLNTVCLLLCLHLI